MSSITGTAIGLDEFRSSLDAWLDEHDDELRPTYEGSGTLDQQMAHLAKVKRATYDAGWMRHGWPEHVGGLSRKGGIAGKPLPVAAPPAAPAPPAPPASPEKTD